MDKLNKVFETEKIKKCPTFTAKIYVGFQEGYSGNIPNFSIDICRKICQDYCNGVGLAVTIKPLEFIYTDGNEPGVEIGLINYPRYPKTESEIKIDAIKLTRLLKDTFKQKRVSIVCSDETYMLGK